MGAKEAGSSFLTGVLAKIPEGQRAQVQAAFEAPEAADALITIGDGVLARSDYSKHMDDLTKQNTDLQAKFTELNDWWTANEAALREYKTIKPEYDTLKAGGKPSIPDPVDARKVAMDVVNEAGREYVSVSAWIAAKAVEHLHRFQEPLDTMALVANPKLGKPVPGQPDRVFSLNDAYQEAYGEKVATHLKAAEDARINKLVEDRLSEERKKHGQPFPLASETVLPIDTLSDPNRPKHDLDSATALYESLLSGRGA